MQFGRMMVLMVFATLFPNLSEAQERRPDTASVRNYPPGSFEPLGIGELVRRVGMEVLLNPFAVIEGMPMADAMMFSFDCRDSRLCNEDRNAALTIKRMAAVADTLEMLGVDRQRIKWLPPKLCKTVDGECRGVVFYINGKPVTPNSGPGDFKSQGDTATTRRLADVEKAVVDTRSQVADHERRISAGEQKNADQDRRHAAQEAKNREQDKEINDIRNRRSGGAGIDLGTTFALATHRGFTAGAPTGEIAFRTEDAGWELIISAGTFPNGENKYCNYSGLFLGAKLHVPVRLYRGGWIVGASSPRLACVDGGPDFAERSIRRAYNLSTGPSIDIVKFKMGGVDWKGWCTAGIALSVGYKARTGERNIGPAGEFGCGIRTNNNFRRR